MGLIVAEAGRPRGMRQLRGEWLREVRNADQRTLREVSSSARVSLGYLSEIERGQKEPSSELLNAICGALGVPLSFVLRRVSDKFDDRDVVAHLGMRAARVAA